MFDTPMQVTVIPYVLDMVFLLFMLFSERSNPSRIIPWAIIFLALPVIGFIAYLMIGQTFYAKHTFKLKGIKDEEIKQSIDIQEYVIAQDETENMEDASIGRTMLNCGGEAYSVNNKVELFTEGVDNFEALFNDLRNAKDFIFIEYFIVKNDELGNQFLDILTDKAKEGLEVKLLSDDLGFSGGLGKKARAFRKAGGQFSKFHAVTTYFLSPKKNNRNHRKIAIIDGKICYCGGFNIGDEYIGKGDLGYWRDSSVRIRGGACVGLLMRFVRDWEYASNGEFRRNLAEYIPIDVAKEHGNDRVEIISGGPDIADVNPIRMEYLQLIKSAKKSVYIHTPYFMPDDSLKDALSLAAASGVDVRVIMPDKPDHMFVYWNNVYCANILMKRGVKIYMYNNGFVHSKTIVVDGKYCSVGSANMDDRSLVLNFETNAMILSKDIGQKMDEAFMKDLELSTEYSCKDYDNIKGFKALRLVISRLFINLT